MKKQFFVAAMAVALGAGLAACSSDNLDVKNPTEVNQKASTYMSVSFDFPAATGTRAANDGQGQANPEFNHKGIWKGQDKIEKVEVYVMDFDKYFLFKFLSCNSCNHRFNAGGWFITSS